MRYIHETIAEEVETSTVGRIRVTVKKLHKVVTCQEVTFDFKAGTTGITNYEPIISCDVEVTIEFLPPPIEDFIGAWLCAEFLNDFLSPSINPPSFPYDNPYLSAFSNRPAFVAPASFLKISDIPSLDSILEETASVAEDDEEHVPDFSSAVGWSYTDVTPDFTSAPKD